MTDSTWMNDPLLNDLDHRKLDFMQKLVFELNGLSEKERLPFMLALANRAKKENVSFSGEEVDKIITVIKKYSSPEELIKMDKMLKLFAQKQGK